MASGVNAMLLEAAISYNGAATGIEAYGGDVDVRVDRQRLCRQL